MTSDALLQEWSDLSDMERVEAFEDLPRDQADEFFLHLSSRDQAGFLLALPQGERRVWLRLLAPDDAADVLQLAPGEDRDALVAQLDEVTRREVNALLAYKEDAAGGLMNPHFARLRPNMTIDEAISYLRRQASHVETIYYGYALDEAQHLLGVVNFRDLFADNSKLVRDIMRTTFVSVSEQMDQEAVARLFSKFHLLAIPVLDPEGRMQGIVTADDVVDVVEVRLGDWWRGICRELSTGLALGSVLAVIGMSRIVLWQAIWKPYGPHYAGIALTVACSLVGVVLFGTIAGSMLPFALRRLGLDPASASAPFVATLVDVTGLVIYFTIATVILKGSLL